METFDALSARQGEYNHDKENYPRRSAYLGCDGSLRPDRPCSNKPIAAAPHACPRACAASPTPAAPEAAPAAKATKAAAKGSGAARRTQCSQDYQAAKKANTLNGQKWSQFYSACNTRLKAAGQ